MTPAIEQLEKLLARLEQVARACSSTVETHWEDASGELIIQSPLQLAADIRVVVAQIKELREALVNVRALVAELDIAAAGSDPKAAQIANAAGIMLRQALGAPE